MQRFTARLVILFAATLCCFAIPMLPVRAEGGLTTIDHPGGGHLVFGPLEDQTSLPEAMGFMLRMVHGHFGDKPQIGKLFRAKNSGSIATFFTLKPKVNGTKPITGLVIVSMPAGARPAAAVIYDDTSRFGKTLNPMLKTLNEAWKPAPAEKGATSRSQDERPVRSAKIAPLRQTPFPDHSGSIGLPEGWHITLAGYGSVHAEGPHGEEIHLGQFVRNIADPRNPNARFMMQTARQTGIPYLAYPFGGDLGQAYVSIVEQSRRIAGKSIPTITMTSSDPAQHGAYETDAVLLRMEFDRHDGKGPQAGSVRVSAMPPIRGSWMMIITGVSAPKPIAQEVWPTLKAIVASWRTNDKVIAAETQQVINNIHRYGDAVTARIKSQHAEEDAHNAMIQQHWDNQDKYSKSFENYQFGRAVIQDNETGEHATGDYASVDMIVKSDPNRYQYVDTPNFLKGVDY